MLCNLGAYGRTQLSEVGALGGGSEGSRPMVEEGDGVGPYIGLDGLNEA